LGQRVTDSQLFEPKCVKATSSVPFLPVEAFDLRIAGQFDDVLLAEYNNDSANQILRHLLNAILIRRI